MREEHLVKGTLLKYLYREPCAEHSIQYSIVYNPVSTSMVT